MFVTLAIIFVLQVVYMAMVTVRFILTVKGYRLLAAPLSAVEILVYTIGLKIVLDNIDKPVNLVVYCISYGIGNFVGSKIEELLPLGFVTVQVYTKCCDLPLAAELRQKGYGVTEVIADGLDGKSLILTIITKRNNQRILTSEIQALDPHALIVAYDPKTLQGGLLFNLYNNRTGKP